jgi:hypothetical protein
MDRQAKYVFTGAAIGAAFAWFISGPGAGPSDFEYSVAAIIGGWIAYNLERST